MVKEQAINSIKDKIFSGFSEAIFNSFLQNNGIYLSVEQVLILVKALISTHKTKAILALLKYLEFKNKEALPKDYHAVDLVQELIFNLKEKEEKEICVNLLKANANPFAVYQFPALIKVS